ncbi:hypothetical protein ACH5RR_023574 [Cinchona calisaya]|uniref:TF-B3 domain-containing protein n=1 Tax=Cinchona calisaya TaxID=153742 RepID=A0ABD2ZB11_9GENT
MSLSSEGNVKSMDKVDSSINATDGEVGNALSQDSQAKYIELHHSKDGLPQKLVDDDFSPLTGKPFCHCIVTKSHVHKLYLMVFPASLHPDLPMKSVPAVVACRGKTWEMMFMGGNSKKRFDIQSWKKFVNDNDLNLGDALFWEVMESSDEMVKFKVQIIRGDFPSELERQVNGETEATPIIID